MHTRFTFIALTFVSLTLIAAVPACSSSPDSKAKLVGWRGFVAYRGSRLGVTPSLGSVDEMERIGGFSFVFPSYIPEGVGDDIQLTASAQTSTDPIPHESISIAPKQEAIPAISISEGVSNPPYDSTAAPTQKIGGVDVSCDTSSTGLWWKLECHWTVENRFFDASFRWLAVATPTDDMRREAMKVVESLILAPEHP